MKDCLPHIFLSSLAVPCRFPYINTFNPSFHTAAPFLLLYLIFFLFNLPFLPLPLLLINFRVTLFIFFYFCRRPEKNPLDLNNLPDDYTRDGKQAFEEGSYSGYRKKKSGAKDGKDECGKVYECRFCSLKFCKSQALGGHMNRHRQERETETLNRARQLVFNSDNLATQGHLGCHPSYHPGGNVGDPILPFRSVYPQILFSGSSSTLMPPPLQPPQSYLHPSPSRLSSYTSQYPTHSINDYYVGHVLGNSSSSQYPHQNLNYLGAPDSNYTCIGAPVGQGFGPGSGRGADLGGSGEGVAGGRDVSLSNQEQRLNWGRSYAGVTQQRLDHPSTINRFQDGF
ncbi:zinc finger protein JAGGED-like [Durio zibethinus]|uniref:Zinc finger protein JAGGED-like n=1 Tax=Durio zibethinus TaxID=66656 RepID=A0A6P6BES3_DURZI|nr:zinc finger protein JAGGED-like [Durio zibethinus]